MKEGFLTVGVSVWGEERICFVVIIGGGWWTAEDVPALEAGAGGYVV